MPKTKIILTLCVLILASLACNAVSLSPEPTPTFVVILEPTYPPPPSNLPRTEADVPRVTLEKALAAYAGGAAVFVDVRDADSFTFNHVAGSINIPLAAIEADPANLDLDKAEWIITYCT